MPADDPNSVLDRLIRQLADAPAAHPAGPALPFVGTSRYQLVRRLGAGGFGVVYLVRDLASETEVALKAIPVVRPELAYRLKNEFRSLVDIRHPNLVAFYELDAGEEQCFFTMEYVPGPDFLTWCRPGGNLDETRLRSGLAQLAAGLGALHRAGKLHRDVKPSNVLLSGERVVLLDFGLSTELQESGLGRSVELAGTPEYMSPEQLRGIPLSTRSDAYSVGVLLYHALTGELPARGGWADLLEIRQRGIPSLPHDRSPDVPRDLSELCGRLLSPEPSARPGMDEVAALLGSTPAGPPRRAIRSDDGAFFGREQELAVLRRALQRVREGRAVTVRVEGRSGAGKTALVEHFLSDLPRDGTTMLRGRCYVRERVPYQGVDSMVDDLCRFLRDLDSQAVEVLMPTHLAALVQLFPVLERVGKVSEIVSRKRPVAPEQHEVRRQAFSALRELLCRIAERHLLVVHIDDLQWSDLDTAALLGEVLRPPDAPAMLLILTARAEDRDKSPGLRALEQYGVRDAVAVPVGPLSMEASLALARNLVHGDGDVDVRMATESGGSPLLLRELALDAAAQGAVDGAPISLRAALESRIHELPPAAARLLEIAAVAGHPLSESVARRAAGTTAPPWAAWSPLVDGHLARFTGPSERRLVEPFHDQVREAVLATLSIDRRIACHSGLATALEEGGGADPEVLARHHEAAGNLGRARELAVEAATQASSVLAFDRAARLFGWAVELGAGDAEDRGALLTSLAGALANAGRGLESARVYLSAAERAPPAVRADLRRRAAEQFLFSGHIDEGRELASDDLRAAGFAVPATPGRALASIVLSRAILRVRGLSYTEVNEQNVPRDRLDILEHLWALNRGLSFLDIVRAAELSARMLRLALRSGATRHIAQALVLYAGHTAAEAPHAAWTDTIISNLDRAVGRVGDGSMNGYSTLVRAIRAFVAGSWCETSALADDAERCFRDGRAGMVWEVWTMRMFSNWSLFFQGRWGELSVRTGEQLAEARELGNAYARAITRIPYAFVTWLTRGDLDGARNAVAEAMAGWSVSAFQAQQYWLLIAECLLDLYVGDGEKAWTRLRTQWPQMSTSLIMRVPVIALQMLHLRGTCALAAAIEARRRGHSSGPLLREADRAARRLERLRMRAARPLGVLLRAGVALQRGREEEAQTLLELADRGLRLDDTAPYAGAARRHLSRMKGQPPASILPGERLADEDAFADMLAPGFPR